MKDDITWDYALSSADNLEAGEYQYNNTRKTKEFRFRAHVPHFTRSSDGSEVAAMCLHCRHCNHYIPLLIREVRFAPLYALNRLMYRK